MDTDYSIVLSNIRTELRNYLTTHNLKSLVLGISGGIDSALVAAIAKPVCDELNVQIIGRSITIDSNKPDEQERARWVGRYFCHDFMEVNLTSKYNLLQSIDDDLTDLTNPIDKSDKNYKIRMGNIKARLRMIYLYNLASKTGGLVLSTDNYTEYLLGFWTLHGDVGDYSMIQYLWKTEVYALTEHIIENDELEYSAKVALKMCIEATATDGLGITNSDLDQILPGWTGSSRDGYAEVDKILVNVVNENSPFYDPLVNPIDETHPVVTRNRKSAFKRNNPTMIPRVVLHNL